MDRQSPRQLLSGWESQLDIATALATYVSLIELPITTDEAKVMFRTRTDPG